MFRAYLSGFAETARLPLLNWILIGSIAVNAGFITYHFGNVNLAYPLVKIEKYAKGL